MFTRLCLNKFLVFFIIFVINTSYANNFSAEYKVSTTGIKIGNFSWSLNINDNIYQTEINLKNSGIFSPLYKFEGSYLSTGVIENNIFKTQNYKQFWKTKKKTKIVKMSFDDYLIELKQEPIEEEIARVDLEELYLYFGCFFNHLKQAMLLFLSLNNEASIKNFMSTMLRVNLRKSKYFRIS